MSHYAGGGSGVGGCDSPAPPLWGAIPWGPCLRGCARRCPCWWLPALSVYHVVVRGVPALFTKWHMDNTLGATTRGRDRPEGQRFWVVVWFPTRCGYSRCGMTLHGGKRSLG